MKCLVTGATGFVGHHLCRTLYEQGHVLKLAVRRELARDDPLFALGDVVLVAELGADTEWCDALSGIEVVVHLASRVHVKHEDTSAAESLYQMINVEGTRKLAQAAVDAGVKRFIFVSSVKAVGEKDTFDQACIPAPEDAYGRSKLAAEDALMEIAQSSNMSVIVLRPPLVYGPGVGANFLRLLRLVDSRMPLPFATVNNRRSLLYVGNLVSAITHCLEVETALSGRYFVSDGSPVSTPELILSIAASLGRPAHLWSLPLPLLRTFASIFGKQGEASRLTDTLVIDDAPFRAASGWEPRFTLGEGLRETAQWYHSR